MILESGTFEITLLTASAAASEGLPMHPDARLIGVMSDEEGTAIGFANLASLKEFIAAMSPTSINFRVGAGEDADLLRLALAEIEGKLH